MVTRLDFNRVSVLLSSPLSILSFSKNFSTTFQQPLLGIDYIDLYMKGLLEPSLQTILVLSYHH
jgi:hypothetical protein